MFLNNFLRQRRGLDVKEARPIYIYIHTRYCRCQVAPIHQGVSPSCVQIQSRFEIHRYIKLRERGDQNQQDVSTWGALSLKVGASAQLSSDGDGGVRRRTAKKGMLSLLPAKREQQSGAEIGPKKSGLLLDEFMASVDPWSSQEERGGLNQGP